MPTLMSRVSMASTEYAVELEYAAQPHQYTTTRGSWESLTVVVDVGYVLDARHRGPQLLLDGGQVVAQVDAAVDLEPCVAGPEALVYAQGAEREGDDAGEGRGRRVGEELVDDGPAGDAAGAEDEGDFGHAGVWRWLVRVWRCVEGGEPNSS